ncbi:MAG: CCA tRNA nucleotidyltransferase [Planctomycetota bacterium]|nr:CCA tRNA nucleotidyltransferase [Planctomycetota bacterium]
MATPNTRHLSRPLAEAARAIATRIAERGARAWIVGGAVRDLCLGSRVEDIDMASALPPGDLEQLFESTIPVGKAFGTMIVLHEGVSVEVTTFRAERGYSDGRRPDEVSYSETPEQDAERRDFTCNALFLDPLTEELLDPTGGLADLEAGVLRTVGDARERFDEDSLRLLRLARFHARFDLEVEPETLEAARASAPGLARVSPERILAELGKILTRRNAHVAVSLMANTGILQAALPGIADLHGTGHDEHQAMERRVEALEWLETSDLAASLALLLDPLDGGRDSSIALLDGLKPSRELRRDVLECWDLCDAIEDLALLEESEVERGPDRSARLRILGAPGWPRARDLTAAWGDHRRAEQDHEGGHLGRNGRELAEFGAELPAGALEPEPLLSSADLEASGIPRGRRWGELLAEAQELQLQAVLRRREVALAWLAEQR